MPWTHILYHGQSHSHTYTHTGSATYPLSISINAFTTDRLLHPDTKWKKKQVHSCESNSTRVQTFACYIFIYTHTNSAIYLTTVQPHKPHPLEKLFLPYYKVLFTDVLSTVITGRNINCRQRCCFQFINSIVAFFYIPKATESEAGYFTWKHRGVSFLFFR